MSKFTVKATALGMTLSHPETGAKLIFEKEGKNIVRRKDPGTLTKKENDNASHAARFISDILVGNLKGVPNRHKNIDGRIPVLIETIKEMLPNISTFRTLNNTLRRHFDTSTTEENRALYFKSHFYEGGQKKLPVPKETKVAKAPVAKKAPVKKAEKPAPVAKKVAAPKKAPVVAKTPAAPKKTPAKKVAPVAEAPVTTTEAVVNQETVTAE